MKCACYQEAIICILVVVNCIISIHLYLRIPFDPYTAHLRNMDVLLIDCLDQKIHFLVMLLDEVVELGTGSGEFVGRDYQTTCGL